MGLVSVSVASKRRLAFAFCYGLVGLAAAAGAFLYGRDLGYFRVDHAPAYCKGTTGFDRCLEKVVASQGASGASVACDPVGLGYLCNVSAGGLCYAVTAKRTSEGFPVTDTVAPRPACP